MSGPANIWNKVAWSLRRSVNAAGFEQAELSMPATASPPPRVVVEGAGATVCTDSRYIARRHFMLAADGEVFEVTTFTDGSQVRCRYASRIAEQEVAMSHRDLALRRAN